MTSAKPTREQADLAEVLEMVLDKGIVINADIAITVGDTEMLGIELRAAIASFETAAKYGLAFPSGTDMQRVEQASGREPLEDDGEVDLGIEASSSGETTEETSGGTTRRMAGRRPAVDVPTVGEGDDSSETGDESADSGGDAKADEADAETDREEADTEANEEGANGEADREEASAEPETAGTEAEHSEDS